MVNPWGWSAWLILWGGLGMALPRIQAGERAAQGPQAVAVQEKSQLDTPKIDITKEELDALLKTIKESKDPKDRLEAMKALTKAGLRPVPKEVSIRLFNTAILDSDDQIRKEAALTIKDLEDYKAMECLYQGVLFSPLGEAIRKNAAEAIRVVDEPRLVEALVTMVTMNLRVGTATEMTPPQILYITNGPSVAVPLGTINLPVELPNIELRNVETTVAVMALSALRTISRRDMGASPEAWQGWLKDWKHIRDVRVKG